MRGRLGGSELRLGTFPIWLFAGGGGCWGVHPTSLDDFGASGVTGRPALLSPPPASEPGPPGAAWVPRRPLRPRSGEEAARTQVSGTAQWAAATEAGMGAQPEGRVGSCMGRAASGPHRGTGLAQVWDRAGLRQDVEPVSMGTEAPPTPPCPAGGEAGDGRTGLGGTGTVGHTVEGGLHLWTPGEDGKREAGLWWGSRLCVLCPVHARLPWPRCPSSCLLAATFLSPRASSHCGPLSLQAGCRHRGPLT